MFDLTVSFSSHFQRKYNVTQGSERAIRPLVKLAKSSSALGDVLMLFQEVGQFSGSFLGGGAGGGGASSGASL